MSARELATLRPSADELCVAVLFGRDPATPPLDLAADRANDARPIIERQIQEAMLRGPLWVAFSGGRDSSALLAIAAMIARREGLAKPIPVTLSFPGVAAADEEAWQRAVLEHLDLTSDWVHVRPGQDLDLIGKHAERVIARHGVIVPPNAHSFLPLLDAMGEGTMVSGSGGDEVLEGTPQRLTSALWSRRRVPRAFMDQCVVHDLPRPLAKRAVRRHSLLAGLHWLRPAARGRLVELEATDRAALPIRFDRLLVRNWADRHFQTGRVANDLIAADTGTTILQPFRSAPVVAALARHWGYRHPGERLASLRPLVGDLLPDAILARQSKAEFVDVFATEATREWVRAWDGTGIDDARVDIDAVRGEWLSGQTHYAAMPLLQQAWLSSADGRAAVARIGGAAASGD